jgi:serine protease Do
LFGLSQPVVATDLGSPIVNDSLEVVALVARACVPVAQPCRLTTVGIPVEAVRAFLGRVPRHPPGAAPWIGADVVESQVGRTKGLRVVKTTTASPASLAGLGSSSAPDLLVAVDGTSITTAEQWRATIRSQAVGDRVDFLVLSRGRYRTVTVTVAQAPDRAREQHPAPPKKTKKRHSTKPRPGPNPAAREQ